MNGTAAPTLLRADGLHGSSGGLASSGLPHDLAERAIRRLGMMALLYAAVFFLAAFLPSLIIPQDRAILFGSVVHWLPGVLSIAVALAVAAIASRPRVPLARSAILAAAFEVASSYGIAAAEFLQPRGLDLGNATWIGLSWVAVWMLAFTIVVPLSPRRSVLAALAAASGVPVMVAISLTAFPPPLAPNAGQFFLAFVFPYLLVVLMAYVGARILSGLGKEVKRAREMGSYHLVELLGRGGMGEVWRAEHRLLARPAAIKLIHSSAGGASDDHNAVRRFEREAQAIASLRSPHTVDLFDFGVTADGTFYYVMELLAGLNAERLVNTFGPLPTERAVYILRQVCHSLSEAASISLVHRDIKPANIVLCRYGEEYDFVKVLDFGIVKAIREQGSPAGGAMLTGMTAEHVVHGTPAFIAPEQVLGTTPIDHRADIYGTGCLAYWLLTGQLVFTGRTSMELLTQHAQAIAQPPSSRTELPIPKELDAIVLSCLEKSPADRPQTARELATLLSAVPVQDPWTPERARAWWEAHRPLG